MFKEFSSPYIDGAIPISTEEIDDHISMTPISYYGIGGENAALRQNHDPINIEDSSGKTPYSVTISGQLSAAKKVLIKAMPFTDHPGRGFEVLREANIADSANDLAVIGISFPGVGLDSPDMTPLQKMSLKVNKPSLRLISSQQWSAIELAEKRELAKEGMSEKQINRKLKDIEYILSGSSQGATNAVGLLESAPEHKNITVLATIQSPSWISRSLMKFLFDYRTANANFKDYTSVNPCNEYEDLGPSHNIIKNIRANKFAHFGIARLMMRGGDIDRVVGALKNQERRDTIVSIASASEDTVAPSLHSEEAYTRIGKAIGPERVVSILWVGHHHPAMENLANSKTAFRQLAFVS